MFIYRLIYRSGFIILLALSIMLCPVATGIYSQKSRAYAGQDFPTVVPINATFAAPVGTAIPTSVPIPTLGPGQFFDDDAKPRLISSHGDDRFGWGELAEDSDLVLIWVTDEQGTQYLVAEKDSDFFLGDDGLKNGFVDYIGNDESGRTQLVNNLENSKTATVISAVAAIGLGIFLIVGPVGWAASLFIAGVAAIGNAARETGIQNQIEESIDDLEFNLLGKFTQITEQLSQP